MSLKSQRLGQIGVNCVERIILSDWQSRWQQIDSQNDDGVDGLIFLERNGEATGQVVFAQVKCRKGLKLSRDGMYRLPIGVQRLRSAYERWRRLIGAAVVIFVDPKGPSAFWVNARTVDPTASQIFVPVDQPFDRNARQEIASMCGNLHRDLLAPRVETGAFDFPHLRSRDHIQVAARSLYRELNEKPVRLGGNGPIVEFTPEGWAHITRRGRPELTRFQSFVLLGTVRKILESITESDLRRHTSLEDSTTPFVAARAAVTFPFRQSAIVKIILRWHSSGEGDRAYRFHTIYEPRRKRDLMGVRAPLSQ